MPIEVFVMILCAAFIHAGWNALVKADGDRLALIKIMSFTQLFLSLFLLPFVSVPAEEAWPYLIASSFVNIGYMLFLSLGLPLRRPQSCLSSGARHRSAYRGRRIDCVLGRTVKSIQPDSDPAHRTGHH